MSAFPRITDANNSISLTASARGRAQIIADHCGNFVAIHIAAQLAGVSYPTLNAWKAHSPEFQEMLLASELKRKHALESEAWRRAINGSDLLLMFMLKAADPATYERSQRVELTGPGGAPLELNDPARAARIAAILSVVVARKAKAAGTADGEVIEAEFIEVVALPSDCRDLL